MNIISVCFSILFVILFILYIVFTMRRSNIKGVYSLIFDVITSVEAYFISRILSNKYLEKVIDYLKTLCKINYEDWIKQDYLDLFFSVISRIILCVVIFLVSFIVLYIINLLIKRIVFRILNKESYAEYEGLNNIPINICLSIVTFILVSSALLYPFATLNGVLNKSEVGVIKQVEFISNNKVLKVYSRPSSMIFDYITRENKKVKNSQELEAMASISMSLLVIKYNQENNISVIKENVTNSYLVSNFLSEMCANAAKRTLNNQPFMGQTIKIPNDLSRDIYIEVLTIISKYEREDFVNDVNTIFEFLEILNKYNNKIKLEDLEFNQEIFLCLFNNDNFRKVLPLVIDYGINSILNEINIKSNAHYVDDTIFNGLNQEEIKNEARIFTIIINQLNDINKYGVEDYNTVISNINEIKKSRILNNALYNVMLKLVQ